MMRARYTIQFGASSWRELEALAPEVQIRILNALEALETDPRGSSTKKLVGADLWRLRVGDYRVIYEIYDKALIVQALRVAHRGKAYR
jgi:mRNA interferase RelE/StbE